MIVRIKRTHLKEQKTFSKRNLTKLNIVMPLELSGQKKEKLSIVKKIHQKGKMLKIKLEKSVLVWYGGITDLQEQCLKQTLEMIGLSVTKLEKLMKVKSIKKLHDGVGNRFSHTCAIAPNASSSIIMGNTSPSIEPYRANCYRQDTLSGSHLNKNRWLDAIIQKHLTNELNGINSGEYDDVWSSIIANDGSVQHLDWMSEHDKFVFKTFMEIDQRWVIEHASDRQQYIDQAQSLNLAFRPDVHIKYLHAIHFMAWKKGLKTLYYCRSEKIGKADKVSKKIERQVIKEIDMTQLAQGNDCISCEG